MRHLISVNDLCKVDILAIFEDAKKYKDSFRDDCLFDKSVITMFFENSTRTRSSFEVAANNLKADVINMDIAKSSTKKGETLFDTTLTINSMKPSAIIVRHENSGVPYMIKDVVNCPIINAGDGSHAHPTQALLDLFTIKEHINPEGKKIAIVGDIKNSRVANSNISLLRRFGMDITLVAPPQFMPKTDLKCSYSIREVAKDVDVIMSLRTQIERHKEPIYSSLKDYALNFCITKDILGDKDILLLHPGPVNRNIDIDDDCMNDSRCKVLEQVENSVYIRMAVLKRLIIDNK